MTAYIAGEYARCFHMHGATIASTADLCVFTRRKPRALVVVAYLPGEQIPVLCADSVEARGLMGGQASRLCAFLPRTRLHCENVSGSGCIVQGISSVRRSAHVESWSKQHLKRMPPDCCNKPCTRCDPHMRMQVRASGKGTIGSSPLRSRCKTTKTAVPSMNHEQSTNALSNLSSGLRW